MTDAKEYRPIPFWSWNDKLEKEKLLQQAQWMKDSGNGGFFMHARSGLLTEYLSEEWMQCIEACAEEAQKLDMKAWLYDENGWPSGFAGGKLLEDEKIATNIFWRQRVLMIPKHLQAICLQMTNWCGYLGRSRKGVSEPVYSYICVYRRYFESRCGETVFGADTRSVF